MAGFNDVVAIFIAEFHTTKGNIVDWSLTVDEDIALDGVEFSVLPSGVHAIDSDVIYFTKGANQGVAVFRRIRTDEEGMRGARLLSVGILVAPSLRPRPWRHITALKNFAVHLEDKYTVKKPLVEYFDLHKARGLSLGEPQVWTGWKDELLNATLDHPAFHLSHVLRILGISSLTIFKHALGRRRVLIYTHPPVEPACLLAQLTAVISSGEEGDSGVVTNRISVLGVVGLIDLQRIEQETKSGRGWVACTTDAIFLEKPQLYDLIIDLTMPSSPRSFRPSLLVSRPYGTTNTGKSIYRLQSVRFTWSDFKLWAELEGLIREVEDEKHHHRRPSLAVAASGGVARWIDPWRVYEDACIVCAGMWTGTVSPKNASLKLPEEERMNGRCSYSASINSRRTPSPVPSASDPFSSSIFNTTQMIRRVSIDPRLGPELPPPSTKAIVTTLSLLSTFHNHTAFLLDRLNAVLPTNSSAGSSDQDPIFLTPKEVTMFDLGPMSDLDARFIEWLAECKGKKLKVRRGWKDLISYLLGFT